MELAHEDVIPPLSKHVIDYVMVQYVIKTHIILKFTCLRTT